MNFFGYPNTLANSTLIILFSKMLKFSKINFSYSKISLKDNSEYLGNVPFVEMNLSKLIDYSMDVDMCWNGQGTTIFDKPN